MYGGGAILLLLLFVGAYVASVHTVQYSAGTVSYKNTSLSFTPRLSERGDYLLRDNNG